MADVLGDGVQDGDDGVAPDGRRLTMIAETYERFNVCVSIDAASGVDEDYLILSTIHSAKGQEWKSVFVMNVVDGCIPSDLGTGKTAEIEEERRLLYVAMTRAKDDLHLIVPQRFFTHGQNAKGDRHVYASRTRFIPNALIEHFESAAWPLAAGGNSAARAGNFTRVDVAAKMKQRWE